MIKTLPNKSLSKRMKPFIFKVFTLIFLFVSLQNKVEASHMMGADISYKCLGSNKYSFTVKVYRDCRGIPFNSPTMQFRGASGCNASVSPGYSLTNIRDITPTCAAGGKKCSPTNVTISSTDPAIEEHTFNFTYDFSAMKAAGCCKIQLGVGQCCRNGAITTGGSGNDFWTYCEIDICTKKCNSSPTLTSEPIAILCCNQPYYYNNGASDTTDFDSLSYSWADPMTSWSGKTTWSGGYNSSNPFSVYWPTGYDKNRGPKPDATPPIGTYLDPETGDIIFTPTNCSETTIASVKVTEWRKDSTGKYQQIGETRRDIQFISQTCPGNNPPLLNGPFKYETCAGAGLCFNITSDDKQFIPPPPAKANPPDTVRLTWNKGIPGGTFNIVDPKARLQTGKFCWTPKKNQASDLPYTFAVTARDNSCPRNAVTVKSYSVKVKPIAEAERTYKKLICGEYAIHSEPIEGFKGNPTYLWEVSDSNNKPLSTSHFYFKSNKNKTSQKGTDSIQFRKGGKYIIHHRINNLPLNCPSDYFDTLIVPPLLEVDLALGPDSFVCAGTTLRLGSKAANGVPRFSYQWFTPTNSSPADTNSYLDVFMSTHDTTFRVEIIDQNKCKAFDTINVFLKPNPKVDMGPNIRICWYDSITITPNAKNAFWIDPVIGDTLQQGDTLWWKWTYDGIDYSTDTLSRIAKRGTYYVNVRDSLGCNYTDTMKLFVNDTLHPNAGPDQVICKLDMLTLTATGLDTSKFNKKTGTYRWFEGIPLTPPHFSTKAKPSFIAQKSNDYILELRIKEDTLTCTGFDTVDILVNDLPDITLVTPQKYCCDYGNIALGSAAFGSPTGGIWTSKKTPDFVVSNVFLTPLACDPTKAGIFSLTYTYQDPVTTCIRFDSTRFTINPLPALKLKDGFYCQDKIEAPLKPHILAPVNLNSMVGATWRLLRTLPKPGGGFNTVSSLVYDADPSLNYDFRLKVDKGTIDLGVLNKDSIILEFTIQDGEGCYNKDTMVIFIWKVPIITFNIFPDLCIDKGKVNLLNLNNTQPTGGCWNVINRAGFRDSSFLKPGMLSCDTLNTLLLSKVNGPGIYWMRYTHTASGCPVQKDTSLRINPLPTVNISITPTGDKGRFCEVDPDVTLNASPAGGVWSSSVPGVIVGGKFSPGAVASNDRDKFITLTYTYTHPSTKCDTVKSLQVYVQSKPIIDILTPDTSLCRMNSMDIKLRSAYAHTSKITWVHSAGDVRANFGGNQQLSNSNPATYTIRPRSDSSTKVFITAFTEAEGVCPFAQDNMIITINPVPHATVTVDDPNGCVPHTVNFTTDLTNEVDSSKAKFIWKYDDGTPNDSTQNPTHIFQISRDPAYGVNLTITSEFGCDTTIGPMPIEVYPLPVANFTPNPNNRTTAALPRFRFTNETKVPSTLGSKIISNVWDFGDELDEEDTSSILNPEYVYNGDTGVYPVRLIVETNFGCKDTMIKPVIIDPDIICYIPNVFSPDNAGPLGNDKFWIVASGFISYQIQVFNRWGEQMYESKDLTKPWDGTYKEAPCQMDAYVYQVNITSYSGELYKYNGTVILLR